MNLENRYQELRREATVLAGEPKDIPQRAAMLHEIYLDSRGNHGFAEIATHGALWGFRFFETTGTLGNLADMPEAPTPTTPDLFQKARDHERRELIDYARREDLIPYFREVESESGPVVTMEGRERLMLGSNNYLGLTGDPRVKAAARDALERYGTGLTGSRLMNGTTPLHRELEEEIAAWMRTEDALVFTTGYQANLGCLSAILNASDTVVADSGDHASILDGCKLSGARLRPFRHQRHPSSVHDRRLSCDARRVSTTPCARSAD